MTLDLKRAEQFLTRVAIQKHETARAKHIYQRRLSPEFSPFQFVDTDELNLSRILAWLLDREGSHGQGVTFLRILAEQFELGWDSEMCEHAARPALEVSIARNGRIDILLTSGNSQIVIENKPYAIDQPDQIGRYFEYLDERMLANRKLVYLTPNGADPTKSSLSSEELVRRKENGDLKLVSYSKDVVAWLSECMKECGSDRVRVFLDQFYNLILRDFKGVMDVSEQAELVDYIISNKEAISAAIAVSSAKNELQDRLLERLNKQIIDIVPADVQFRWNVNRLQRLDGCGLEFDYSPAQKFVFRIEFFSIGLREPNFGIKAKDQKLVTKEEALAVAHAISSSPIGARKEGGTQWPWWGKGRDDHFLSLENDWNISDRPWLEILDGTLATSIVGAAIRVREALNA